MSVKGISYKWKTRQFSPKQGAFYSVTAYLNEHFGEPEKVSRSGAHDCLTWWAADGTCVARLLVDLYVWPDWLADDMGDGRPAPRAVAPVVEVKSMSCDAMTVAEMMTLTVEELKTVEEFDAGLDVMRHFLPDGDAHLELWWAERQRRILAARVELEQVEDAHRVELEQVEGAHRVEMSEFAWSMTGGHDDLDAMQVEAVNGVVVVWLTLDQVERAHANIYACAEEVGEGTWADETSAETWSESIKRQTAQLCTARDTLATLLG